MSLPPAAKQSVPGCLPPGRNAHGLHVTTKSSQIRMRSSALRLPGQAGLLRILRTLVLPKRLFILSLVTCQARAGISCTVTVTVRAQFRRSRMITHTSSPHLSHSTKQRSIPRIFPGRSHSMPPLSPVFRTKKTAGSLPRPKVPRNFWCVKKNGMTAQFLQQMRSPLKTSHGLHG